jgi:FAD dependent oxidoreductase
MQEIKTDILIVGAGVGGCAAALAACAAGLNVVLTEESDWVGGQFTTQATPPDEHGWIEEFGCTRSYRKFREKVRKHYKTVYPLTKIALENPFLNPGDGWVSPLCAEPLVFLTIFEESLTKYVGKGNLRIFTEHFPVSSDSDGNFVRGVTLKNTQTDKRITVSAKYFVDATELGDLLPLTKTEFVTGSEAQSETGEPSAKENAASHNSQAFSMCFAMSYDENADNTIEKPENYEFWRDFIPDLNPAWSGKLLSLTGLNPRTLEPVNYNFAPNNEENKAFAGLWTYRRILHKENFREGAYSSDITLVNYPQIDYILGDPANADYAEKQRLIREAKQQSLSFLYYLQTEKGFRGLKLRPDVVGTKDGLAKMPYVRESRRIKAELTILEQHVSAALRPNEKFAEKFADSVGVGFYRIDLHPTVGGDNYVDVESLPFQIPLGALIPQRMENLLPACKNIGTTHITNGCYRLHPIEWNIGEAVGNLLAFCLDKKAAPREVYKNAELLADYQKMLVKNGFELDWRQDLNLADGDPHRHAT